MSKRKQSMIIGGLISSAGIFISKFLGLLYVIPFNEMLGGGLYNAYYSQAYNLYSYMLNIATAGLPFAIAILISRYSSREDYQTCLLVKKISFRLMASFGFVCMILMILFSTPIASAIVPDEGNLTQMRNVIIIISFAVFIIPILSSLRGFYQGLKELEIYSVSQVLEQLARIIFLLAAGAITVYVFHLDAIWAVYFGVFAASISGLLTILYIKSYDKSKVEKIKKLAENQDIKTNISSYEILRELVFVAFPFLLTAIFGYADTIINQFHLVSGLHAYGIKSNIALYQDAVFYKASKIIAIPMILAPGFSTAIIPYITSALEKKNKKLANKYILECIELVFYLAIPICLIIFLYPQAITYTLFGGAKKGLEIDTYVLHWFAIEAFFATVCPIFTSLVMAIGKRKQVIYVTASFAIIKLVINYPLVAMFGVPGMIFSSMFPYMMVIAINTYLIQKDFHLKWIYTLRKLMFMVVGAIGIFICYYIFSFTGMINYTGSRFISLIYLGIMSITTCIVYFAITYVLQIPQSIFHIDIKTIISKFRK